MLLNQPQNQYRHARSINLQNLTHTTRPDSGQYLDYPVKLGHAASGQRPFQHVFGSLIGTSARIAGRIAGFIRSSGAMQAV